MTPAQAYDQYFVPAVFGPLAERLVDHAAPQPAARVLDLACGTGAVAYTVAPRLGASGKVVGVDLRPGMIEAARSKRASGESPEFHVGDATALDFGDEEFDLVFCQQGLQFFGDRLAALREIRRTLAVDGRFVAAVWQPIESHPVWEALSVSEFRHLGPLGVTKEDILTPFSLGDAEEIRSLLDEAGFREHEVRADSLVARFADADHFVERMEFAFSAVIPEFAEDRSAFYTFVERVTAETRDVLEAARVDDTIQFSKHFWLITARR